MGKIAWNLSINYSISKITLEKRGRTRRELGLGMKESSHCARVYYLSICLSSRSQVLSSSREYLANSKKGRGETSDGLRIMEGGSPNRSV